VNAIIAFLHIHKQPGSRRRVDKGNALADPIKGTIPPSSLVVDLQPVTQIPASNPVPPLTRITKMSYRPDTHDLFVVDLRGKLYRLDNNKPSVYLDLAKQRPRFIHEPGLATGFGSFAFHPDFAKNGLLYTTHTEIAGTGKADFGYPDSIKVSLQFVLTEWKTAHPAADTFSGTSRELLRIDMITESHGVQEITFNPGSKPGDGDYGLLYMGIGDGGCVQVGYPYLLRGKESVWGTVLRLDPKGRNSANGKYGIPRTNPFVEQGDHGHRGDHGDQGDHGDSKALGEIYAYGFRNPQRITWSASGELLICNIGQANIEALYVVRPGDNCGWPMREGSFAFDPSGNLNKVYPLPPDDSLYKITYPVAEYDHDDGNAWAGGYEYRGTAIPALRGKYLFGDIPSGRLFYIDMADIESGKLAPIKQWNITINGVPRTLKDVCGSDRVDLHFGRDAAGELYIMTKADGRIYKLVTAHQ
jgi:glucose/arabinose dehydrogenase